jgi:hypothetical protein
MKKRINSTGRKRINHENVAIYLNHAWTPNRPPAFSADLSFPSQLKLDPRANVYVEAYVRSSTMRFSFGTVGLIRPPIDTVLTDLDHGAAILFRVKVVDDSAELGKIVAAVDGIRPLTETDDADGRKALLPLVKTDLGEAVWKIHLQGSAPPVLQINNRIPDLRERLFEDPLLAGAIYTEALRQVLNAVFSDEYDDEIEWVINWKKFIAEVRGIPVPDDIDEEDNIGQVQEIIEDTIEKFVGRRQFATKAIKAREATQND